VSRLTRRSEMDAIRGGRCHRAQATAVAGRVAELEDRLRELRHAPGVRRTPAGRPRRKCGGLERAKVAAQPAGQALLVRPGRFGAPARPMRPRPPSGERPGRRPGGARDV
jgi:hypothetical protein